MSVLECGRITYFTRVTLLHYISKILYLEAWQNPGSTPVRWHLINSVTIPCYYFLDQLHNISSVSVSGCFLQYVMTIGGVIRCFGIFYVAFMEEFNSKAGSAAWIAVLVGIVTNVAGKTNIFLKMR